MDTNTARLARLRADIAAGHLCATERCRRRGPRRLDRPVPSIFERAGRDADDGRVRPTGVRRGAARFGGDDGDTSCRDAIVDGRSGARTPTAGASSASFERLATDIRRIDVEFSELRNPRVADSSSAR